MRLGTKLVQRDNFEYEFTVALDLVHDGHFATAIKDRTQVFSKLNSQPITEETGSLLLEWLNDDRGIHDILKSYVLDISAMETSEELANLFSTAYREVKGFDDEKMLAELVEAKDKRKQELGVAA